MTPTEGIKMSGECDDCGHHNLECICKSKNCASKLMCDYKLRLEFAMSALNLALQQLSILGFEFPKKFTLEIKKKDGMDKF